MKQKLIGYTAVALGVYLLTENEIFLGALIFLIGGGVANGADHGTWVSFHFDGDSGSGSGSGDCGGE